MKFFKYCIFFILLTTSYTMNAEILWVGISPTCTGSNVYNSFNSARSEAFTNGQFSNEIRMTRTIDYTSNFGKINIGEEFGSNQVIISGGYEDCFSEQIERTFIGSSNASSFDIDTGIQNTHIILRNLILAFNDSRGVVARGNVFLQLDNVDINNNGFSGLDVGDGATVEVLSTSLVRFNENIDNPFGGGVRCTGTNSSVSIFGRIEKNRAQKGANIFVSTGCYAQLMNGVRIVGGSNGGGIDAVHGGGLYVDDGGEVFADGRANRVIFDANKAEIGGAIYLNGSGFALLQNTHINGSHAPSGSAIFAINGGTGSQQLIMDQTTQCGQLFGCSEIQGSQHQGSVIETNNSFIDLRRTVIEQSEYISELSIFAIALIEPVDSRVRLNRVGMIRNEGYAMLATRGETEMELTHFTMAENENVDHDNSWFYLSNTGNINVQNSLITNSSGVISGGTSTFIGDCNLIDNSNGWPVGIYNTGTPELINPLGGDARQMSSSPGVDMCLQDSFTWSTEIDIENQAAPVNENTNPQGMPGQPGGLFDVGFDEVYDNIGEDEFLLSVTKLGSGLGIVESLFPIGNGINCGFDCSEIYFRGTIVFLSASPDNDSEFIGWENCTEINNDNQCLINMQSSHTVRAVFEPDDLIFKNGFE